MQDIVRSIVVKKDRLVHLKTLKVEYCILVAAPACYPRACYVNYEGYGYMLYNTPCDYNKGLNTRPRPVYKMELEDDMRDKAL